MASREGIALLSMYSDEDDEDMEDFNHQHQEGEVDEKDLQTDNGQERTPIEAVQSLTPSVHATPQSSEHAETLQPDEMDDTAIQSETAIDEDASNFSESTIDFLNNFLPPPTKEMCPEALSEKIETFINLKKKGRSFNAEVRNKKAYRNPDFLLHAVRYQDIDEIGSCFSKDVFDPHGYDKSDFVDEIEADMRRERERKEQELKKSPKVEFVTGGTQPGQIVPPSKFSMPIPVAAPSGLPSAPTAAEGGSRDGRQNKKSKWDRV